LRVFGERLAAEHDLYQLGHPGPHVRGACRGDRAVRRTLRRLMTPHK
jgi:hypothetical protein